MHFSEIPQFPKAYYTVDTSIRHLENTLEEYNRAPLTEPGHLKLQPIFQRGYVWTKNQQIQYMEYLLKGGEFAKTVIFNCPNWMEIQQKNTAGWSILDITSNHVVCVDGQQRIRAIRAFLQNKIPAFNTYFKDFEEKIPLDLTLRIQMLKLQTPQQLLQAYIDYNTGGSVHSETDLKPAIELLNKIKNT